MSHLVREPALRAAEALGLFGLVARSRWRQSRFLILCFHGVSQDDEHEWDGQLYITPQRLRERFDLIRGGGYNVLPLGEALSRIKDGSLPQRTLVLTFDDGATDFSEKAYPILQEYGFPATLYLTTHYVLNGLPVFNTMLSYVLWKARGRELSLQGVEGGRVLSVPEDARARAALWREIQASLPPDAGSQEKDSLLDRIADQTGIDMASLRRRRVLHLMKPEQVRSLDPDLVDVQLHTHRHRTPNDRALYWKEIEDNRAAVRGILSRGNLDHFCYPSGIYEEQHLEWLREMGAHSATTCDPGLVSERTDPLLLPRYIDTMYSSRATFLSWISGLTPFILGRGG
jgi:peptidoglycan/xylan/chitin deacetylase (PgdA/CDA1 family)